MVKTCFFAAALGVFSVSAAAGWSCTMPSGVVIYNLLSSCPTDAVKIEQRETALPSPTPAPKKKTPAPEPTAPKINALPDEPPARPPPGRLIGQPKGYIMNDSGGQCWYTQTAEYGAYFHSLPGNRATLVFDNPRCMSDSGVGLDINRMMINHIIVRPYSHSDASFKSRPDEMYKTSLFQVRGACIQSARYPAISVAIEYFVSGSSIYQVRHAANVGPCSGPAR